MGIFDAIKGMFGGASTGMRNGRKAFFVDCARLGDEKTGRRLSPRDQVAILNALARIHEEEGFDMAAIFEAERPLREVENGGEYKGVVVYFAADAETLIEDALRLAKKGSYTLVTSGPSLESKATEMRLPLFSSSTFRKAFLANLNLGGDRHHRRDRDDRGPRGGDRPRRDRRRNRHGGESSGGVPGEAVEPTEAAPAEEAAPAAADAAPAAASEAAAPAVRNLIDLVE